MKTSLTDRIVAIVNRFLASRGEPPLTTGGVFFAMSADVQRTPGGPLIAADRIAGPRAMEDSSNFGLFQGGPSWVHPNLMRIAGGGHLITLPPERG